MVWFGISNPSIENPNAVTGMYMEIYLQTKISKHLGFLCTSKKDFWILLLLLFEVILILKYFRLRSCSSREFSQADFKDYPYPYLIKERGVVFYGIDKGVRFFWEERRERH